MNRQLSDEEKKRLAEVARDEILPIAQKYEMDDRNGMDALFEAFQAGIRFTIDETKRAQEGVINGNDRP